MEWIKVGKKQVSRFPDIGMQNDYAFKDSQKFQYKPFEKVGYYWSLDLPQLLSFDLCAYGIFITPLPKPKAKQRLLGATQVKNLWLKP